MKFEVHILGAQAALPTTNRGATAQLVNHLEQYYLIDCAEGTQLQLRKQKLKFQRINHIFISHMHGDHFLGLPGLLSSFQLLGRTQPLKIYCPAGGETFYETYKKVSNLHLGYEIEFIHLVDRVAKRLLFENDRLAIYSFPLDHRIPCWGFHFQEKKKLRKVDPKKMQKYAVPKVYGKKLQQGEDYIDAEGKLIAKNHEMTSDPDPSYAYTYMTDTRKIENIRSFIDHTTVLYHEATFLHQMVDRAHETFHSTAKEAAEVATMLKAKKLILGHFSARYSNTEVLQNEAESVFSNVVCAKDGVQITIP